MRDNATAIPLLVIAGPTAAGKTEVALRVAEALGGEIVSADSMQIYRRMDIGTAKPGPQERARASIHLIDFVEPDAQYTVVDFQRDARAAIEQVWERGALPILCGGTGLYLRAVLSHLDFPPGPQERSVRERLRAEAAKLGSEHMHARLAQLDPPAARTIAPGDARRIVRALEVIELTGRQMSAQQSVDRSPPFKYNLAQYVLTAPRELLFQRIDRRVDAMMTAGWLDEVCALRAEGVTAQHQSIQAIGYRHLMAHLDGEPPANLTEVVALIKRDTRRYAKRQMTWLRAEEGYGWLAPGDARQWRACVALIKQAAARLRSAANGG